MKNLQLTESRPHWDRQLIDRYDLSGPRYTSYPTAPQFHEGFSDLDWHAAVERSNSSGRPLSLYFHIPFCSTVCYYCGCNKVITANRKHARPYLERLIAEMALQASLFDCSRPVDQLHWGGGTPTYISDDEKRLLMSATREYFNLHNNDSGEYSIEIHPGDMEAGTIHCLRELGFNRLSMGIQDFDPIVQQAVNRFNSVAQVQELVDAGRKEGFHSISMDLIYGLPHQTWDSFSRTLDAIIDLSPDRLSVFNYAHMPHLFKVQKQIDEKALPPAAEKLVMLERMTNKLLDAGYCYIGMDHFAKPGDELAVAQQKGVLQRNFQGYSTHGNCDLLAFGVSSISAIDNVFVQNHKQLEHYQQAIDQGQLPIARGFILNRDDLIRQHVIKELICQFSLDFTQVEQQFGICFSNYFHQELQELEHMEQDGLLEIINRQSLQVTSAGRLLIRRICMVFDAYLNKASAPEKAPGANKTAEPEIHYSKII